MAFGESYIRHPSSTIASTSQVRRFERWPPDLQDMPLMISQRGQIIRWHSARTQQWWAGRSGWADVEIFHLAWVVFFWGRGTLKWISSTLYLKKVQQKFRSTLIWLMQKTSPSQVAFINCILLVLWCIVPALACLGVDSCKRYPTYEGQHFLEEQALPGISNT